MGLMNVSVNPETATQGIPAGNDRPLFGGQSAAADIFNRRYVNAMPQVIREIMRLPAKADRLAAAITAKRKDPMLLIDREIVIEGGTGQNPMTAAFGTMLNRVVNGFMWWPTQTLDEMEKPTWGVFVPEPYQGIQQPNPQAVKVSLNPGDFPAAFDLILKPCPFDARWPVQNVFANGKGRAIGTQYASLEQDDKDLGSLWEEIDSRSELVGQVFLKSSWRASGLYYIWIRVK